VSVADLMAEEGRTQEEIEKTLSTSGVSRLSVERDRNFAAFTHDALNVVLQRAGGELDAMDGIIVVSQTFNRRIPAISPQIKEQIGASSSAFCIDVMDGCNGFIKAVAIAKMLERNGARRILVVAGDMNSSITHDSALSTRILFGDGLGISVFENDDTDADWEIFSQGDSKSVISCQTFAGPLVMNGFEVFRFTRSVVSPMVLRYLRSRNLQITDFDLVGLHQASKLVVETMAETLGVSDCQGRRFTAGEYGNIGAGSIQGWLAEVMSNVSSDDLRMLAVGFGAGLSWGLSSFCVKLRDGGQFNA